MNTPIQKKSCPRCGATLPAEAAQGVCPRCVLLYAATATETGMPAVPQVPPALADVQAALPHLEIQALIGRGAMGAVYRALQPKLDRLVAVKVLIPSLAAGEEFTRRFLREAQVLARLNHPGIVAVYDYGEAGGFYYLLMEYVQGVNLRQALRSGGFTPEQALALVPKICEALQYAHDEGVLHRDIKPENVLIDTRGRVKMADFGIAKLLGERRGQEGTLTGHGHMLGTPNYMAPEQVERPHEVDQRADIYSLGVIFYEMLTGELPLGRFAPPSAKSSVDARVDGVVLQALAQKREQRQSTATMVREQVETIVATPENPAAAGKSMPVAARSPDKARPTGAEARNETPAQATSSAGAADFTEPLRRVKCYCSTPWRMRQCFPAPAAHIFHCAGELCLEKDRLVFMDPWRREVSVPWAAVRHVSIGQFQMWTTPWVMKYERFHFLSLEFEADGRVQEVCLLPVAERTAEGVPPATLEKEWYAAITQAIQAHTGRTAVAKDPAQVTYSAEPSWNRKGIPLFLLGGLGILLGLAGLHGNLPVFYAVSLAFTLLLWGAAIWFSIGFLRANTALQRGDYDAVTAGECPRFDDPAQAPSSNPARGT